MSYKFNADVYIFRAWELIAIMFIAIGTIEFYVKSWSTTGFVFILLSVLIYVIIPSIKREKENINKIKRGKTTSRRIYRKW